MRGRSEIMRHGWPVAAVQAPAVLSEERAGRLAGSAGRRRGDGSRGPLARRAWRILYEAGDRGDQAAINAVLQAWLGDPDDERWQVLTRWRGAEAMTAAVLAAAADGSHTAPVRAAIGAFCARHELVPEDPAERALFFVLTGRTAEHEAADPDLSLIGAAYQKAGLRTRSAVREAMALAGDLDLPHVIADRRDRAGYIFCEERDYLVRHLADEGDWERLWRLTVDLPLADAVASVRQAGGSWRPDRDADRVLFDRLACADPKIARAYAGLNESEIIRIEMDDPPTHGAFSPDGRALLVATARGGRYSGCRVFDLPAGTLAERHDYRGDLPPAGVVHLGDSLVLVGRRQGDGSARPPAWELVRYAADGVNVLHRSEHPMAVAPGYGGCIVVETQQSMRAVRGRGPADGTPHNRNPLAEITGIRVQHRDAGGNVYRNAAFSSDLRLGSFPAWLEPLVAVEPSGSRMVIGIRGLAVLDLYDQRVVASRPSGRERQSPGRVIRGACFPRSDRLATIDRSGRVRLYQLDGDQLQPKAGAKVTGAPPHDLVAFPRWASKIAVIDSRKGLRYLDADTLNNVKRPRELARQRGTVLFGSPDGRHYALGGSRDANGFVHVLWTGPGDVAALAHRPMGTMTRADLAVVTARLRELRPGAAGRPFLDLLRIGLERRFAAGSGTGLVDGSRDVAASPGE